MKIINQQAAPFITIVGCQHGDEHIGFLAYEFFLEHLLQYPSVQFILANEPAIAANRRFIEQDLNRCFPGDANGSGEMRLAAELLLHVQSSRYVLDLHTTTSDILMTPIATHLNADSRRIINLCTSTEIALIESPFGKASLIGQCNAGVSLEYNEQYAKTAPALLDVFRIVDGLVGDQSMPTFSRKIYRIISAAPSAIHLPDQTKNFVYSPVLEGYSFLFGEKAYPNGLISREPTEEVM